MEAKKLISIVMPMYNASEFLHEALTSLRKQTYKNFEVIIVDDGSTDNSVEIVEKIIKADSRFSLIRQKNQHAGIARNNGLNRAQGDYVIFLDADDIFHRNMLDELIQEAEHHDVDIITFGFYRFSKKYYKHKFELKYAGEAKRPIEIRDDLFNIDTGVPWNKLYKMDFVRKIGLQFQDTINTNDVYFTRLSFALADEIYFSDKILLSYRIGNKNSLQGTNLKSPDSFFIAFSGIVNELKKRNLFETYSNTTKKMLIDGCIGYLDTANTPDLLFTMYDYTKQLFSMVDLKEHDEAVLKSKRNEIVLSILSDDFTGCIMNIYLSYKSKRYEASTEYRIGKAVNKILRIK